MFIRLESVTEAEDIIKHSELKTIVIKSSPQTVGT